MKKTVIERVVAKLKNDAEIVRYASGNVFSFTSRKPIDGAFVSLGKFQTAYERTKDGNFPSRFTFDVTCVADSLTVVDKMAAAVSYCIDELFISEIGDAVRLVSDASDFDGSDYFTTLTFTIDF